MRYGRARDSVVLENFTIASVVDAICGGLPMEGTTQMIAHGKEQKYRELGTLMWNGLRNLGII